MNTALSHHTCLPLKRLARRHRRPGCAKLVALLAISLAFCGARRFAGATEIIATAFPSGGSATDYIIAYDLFGPGLFWWQGSGDCSLEFRSYSAIGIKGSTIPAAIPSEPVSD